MQKINSFIITKDCNMACDYCYFKRPNKPEYMSFKQLLIFIQQLYMKSNKDTERIMLFGGEPLMNWELIVKLCDFKKKLAKPLQVYIMTNGLLLDEEKIKFLNTNKIILSISYDGSTTNKHRKTNVVNNVQEHLHKIFDIYKKLNYYVAITWCLCEDGIKNLEKDVDFLIQKYGDTICNLDINPVDLIDNKRAKKVLANVMKKYPNKICGFYCEYCVKNRKCFRQHGKTRAVEVTHFSSDGKIYDDINIKETMKK